MGEQWSLATWACIRYSPILLERVLFCSKNRNYDVKRKCLTEFGILGLRFGEMEKDNLVSHGTAKFLQSRLMDMSDGYNMCVCGNCGKGVVYNKECNVCGSNDPVYVKIPYCFKLLTQYMNGICMRADFKVWGKKLIKVMIKVIMIKRKKLIKQIIKLKFKLI